MQSRNGQRSLGSPRSSVNATALFNSAASLEAVIEGKGLALRSGLRKKLGVLGECRSLPVLSVKKKLFLAPEREKTEQNRGKCKLKLGKTSDGFDSDDSVINELAEILSIPSPRLPREDTAPCPEKQMRKLRVLLPKSPLNSLATSRLCFTSRTVLGSKHLRPYKLLV